MKHLLVAAVILTLGLGAYVMTQGSGGGDRLAERDALFEGPVLVEFEAGPPSPQALRGFVPWEGYRLRWLPDGTWLFEGQSPGSGGVARIVHNGHGTLTDYAEGCFSADSAPGGLAEIAFTPGLTGAETLLQGIAIDRDDDIVGYALDGPEGQALRIEEDLSTVDQGYIVTALYPDESDTLVGTFTISRLDGEALAAARAEAEAIVPTDQAVLAIRWRPLGEQRIDPEPVASQRTIFRICPQLFGFGQHLRLAEAAGGGWVLENGLTVDVPIDAPEAELIAASLTATRGTVPLRPGTVIVEPERRPILDSGSAPAGFIPAFALEIVSCEETDWFRCGEPPEPGER